MRIACQAVICLLLILGPFAAGGQQPAGSPPLSRVIVTVRPQNVPLSSTASRILSANDVVTKQVVTPKNLVDSHQIAPGMVNLTVTEDGLSELRKSQQISSVFEDKLSKPLLFRSVPLIHADALQQQNVAGKGVAVAVVDTGVDATHPALRGRVIVEACFSSTVPAQSSQTLCPDGTIEQRGPGAAAPCDVTFGSGCGHGTHVAGIAASAAGNFSGKLIVGVAPQASIIAIQVFSRFSDSRQCDGQPQCVRSWTSDQIRALDYIAGISGTTKIAAVNMSLGSAGGFTGACDREQNQTVPIKDRIDRLRQLKIATVIAAGNDGWNDKLGSPACISTAISVGASDQGDLIASFSDRDKMLSILAPGANIESTWLANVDGGYHLDSGTSMAAPHVAGAFALLWSAYPNASLADIQAAVLAGGKQLADTNRTIYRLLDLTAAMQVAKAKIPSAAVALALEAPASATTTSLTRVVVSTAAGSAAAPSAALSFAERNQIHEESEIAPNVYRITAPTAVVNKLAARFKTARDAIAAPSSAR